MINWRSMLAADRIFFNSRFHRADWFAALPNVLKHFPDYQHLDHVPAVRAKSQVLPVGCDLARLDRGPKPQEDPPLILWNQRWEYDKDPRTFFKALDALVAAGVDFRVALAGSNVRQQPEEFEAARARLGERVVHYGRADAATYRRLLRAADVVVSTAIHEFFGVAVVEATYCRCFPVLPHRLAYPELLPERFHGRSLYRGFDALVDRLTRAITHPAERRRVGAALSEALARFDWSQQAPAYDAALASLAHQKSEL
jgi:glycosyltransferase involved in cell wall biosynthesis